MDTNNDTLLERNQTEELLAKLLEKELDPLKKNLDTMFMIFSGMIIIFMQAGFALIETGTVRAKNALSILIKNMSDMFFGNLFKFKS